MDAKPARPSWALAGAEEAMSGGLLHVNGENAEMGTRKWEGFRIHKLAY